jgi:hypothetical protein
MSEFYMYVRTQFVTYLPKLHSVQFQSIYFTHFWGLSYLYKYHLHFKRVLKYGPFSTDPILEVKLFKKTQISIFSSHWAVTGGVNRRSIHSASRTSIQFNLDLIIQFKSVRRISIQSKLVHNLSIRWYIRFRFYPVRFSGLWYTNRSPRRVGQTRTRCPFYESPFLPKTCDKILIQKLQTKNFIKN